MAGTIRGSDAGSDRRHDTELDERRLLWEDGEGLLTLEEAARYLGLAKDHKAPVHAVRYLCRTRKLRFLKVGKTLRFRREWLDEYIDSQSIAPIRRT